MKQLKLMGFPHFEACSAIERLVGFHWILLKNFFVQQVFDFIVDSVLGLT